ncbi:MAG: cupin domain-containing protein [Candidatus Marinimicrobia bacterium]|nr:cupin domain-containing protein [Candidatus Neomarinimicrobiota bacterium]
MLTSDKLSVQKTKQTSDIDENTIGPRIRKLRRDKNITLSHLAEFAGCTNATISKIERNKMTPSISVLKGIVNALGLTLAEFLTEENHSDLVIMRKDQRIPIKFPSPGIQSELLTTNLKHRLMEPLFEVIKPGAGSKGEYIHDGEEFVLVLKGKLTIIIRGDEHVLNAGDSMYFSSIQPHGFSNRGTKTVEVVWIITPPTY